MTTIPDFKDVAGIPPAIVSSDGRYRYLLTRNLPVPLGGIDREKAVLFVMLNPSTADASHDDPTIRRCLGYAAREDATRLWVCNLSPLRATDPRVLLRAGPDPAEVRDTNFRMTDAAARAADLVIVAWGVNGKAEGRDRAMLGILSGIPLVCLGTTGKGQPFHPLMQPTDAELVAYLPPATLIRSESW